MFSKLKRCVLTLGKIRCPNPLYIKGDAVEREETHKYLGVVLGSKLSWKENISSVGKKVNWRMYCFKNAEIFRSQLRYVINFL